MFAPPVVVDDIVPDIGQALQSRDLIYFRVVRSVSVYQPQSYRRATCHKDENIIRLYYLY